MWLISCWIFCISKNSLGLCSWTQLNYLETVWSFQGTSLGSSRAALSLGLTWHHYWGKTLLRILILWIMRFFHSGWKEQALFIVLCNSIWGLFLLTLSGGSFPSLIYMCWSEFSWRIRGGSASLQKFSLYTVFSSLVSCLANSSCPSFSNSQLHILIHLTLPGFLLPVLLPGNALQAVSWGNHGAHLVCFLSLRNHCSLLPGVRCLKTIVFILSGFSLVSGKRVNPVPVPPFWPELRTFTSERNKWLYCLTHCYFGFSVICIQV